MGQFRRAFWNLHAARCKIPAGPMMALSDVVVLGFFFVGIWGARGQGVTGLPPSAKAAVEWNDHPS